MCVETVLAYFCRNICKNNRVFLHRGFELGSRVLAEVVELYHIAV